MEDTRTTWRRRVARHWPRLRRPEAEVVEPPDVPGLTWILANEAADPPAPAASEFHEASAPMMSDVSLAALVQELEITEGELLAGPPRRAGEDFMDLMRETYPSVADLVITLATEDPGEHVQEWLEVARALSDAKRTTNSTLKSEARERALCVAIAHALEAQARSSARLAGWSDEQLDDEWEVEPRRPGERIWEHYLCRQAELMRASLHGESIGTWLGALGDLWESANELLNLLDAPYTDGIVQARKDARVALRASLVHVQELALW